MSDPLTGQLAAAQAFGGRDGAEDLEARGEGTPTGRGSQRGPGGGDDDPRVQRRDEEEAHILPLVREHITGAEWDELGRKSFDKFPRSARPVMLGQLLEEATPDDRALFFGKLPVFPRLMWLLAGRRSYARYTRRVRG